MEGRMYRLGPRVPIFADIEEASLGIVGADSATAPNTINLPPSRVMPRDASSTCTAGTADLCEKPASSATLTIPIVLGIAVPLIGAAVVLLYLHRRNTRRLAREDLDDPHKSLDFGMGEGKKRKSAFFGGKEKDPRHRAQLSMDMNLSSPYLLPPQLQGSRDSLHSLARSLKKDGDPYGPVDDVCSIKSGRPAVQRKNTDGMSVYTASSDGRSRTGTLTHPPPRQNSLPHSNSSAGSPLGPHVNPFESHAIQEDNLPPMPSPPAAAAMPQGRSPMHQDRHAPQMESSPYAEDNVHGQGFMMSDSRAIPEPPPAAAMPSPAPYGRSSAPNDDGFDFQLPVQSNNDQFEEDSHFMSKSPAPQRQSPQDLGLLDPPAQEAAPPPLRKASLPSEPRIQYPEEDDFKAYTPAPAKAEYEDDVYSGRGRHPSRRSNMMGEDGGLALPQQDNKRLSVGNRPLPPSEVMETEDPDARADRIRSFYKEYFDDSKRESVVPPVPTMPFQSNRETQGTDYYEDYDQEYMGDNNAFFDPDANAFVMPYAEPVTRRAMTPPPRGRVPGGPFRGARPHAGSVGGMSLPGGRRGPPGPGGPRAASGMSGPFRGPPSMPGSAPGSRAGSRAGSRTPMNRKPMPPPAPLSTLPTPSKLRDDSFALLGSIDFAPPVSYAERTAGRSQSPIGERKAYQLNVPIASPLSSSYDEMAALPSPHLLRKSGTFTGLDFAPPKKFKDPDTMSDAGSIRSNRTGISAVNDYAIRTGAGRASKLPGDVVFTQAQLGDQLKPQWGMRP